MSETVGHFSIYGDFEAKEITDALGMQPSSVTPKGTLFEGADHPSLVTDWELYCPEDLTMREQIDFLLRVFWPVKDSVRRLADRYTVDFNISGEGREVMHLNTEALEHLAELKVNLNCFFTSESNHAD